MRGRPAVTVVLALACLALPAGAAAQIFFDARIGAAATQNSDVETTFNGQTSSESAAFEETLYFGVRTGYWLRALPWLGFAGDLSAFSPDEKGTAVVVGGVVAEPAEIDVLTVTPMLMLRAPLFKDEGDHPFGRLQPYVAIGPGVFVSSIRLVVQPIFTIRDRTASVGVDARAGLHFRVNRNVGIFAEYRYTAFSADWQDLGFGFAVDLETNHIAAGIGYSF